jgi:hypothetical protein
MPRPDLNLLVTLHAVLTEGSVARAARRLRLSSSAMSRALARLRDDDGGSAAGDGPGARWCPRRGRSTCAGRSSHRREGGRRPMLASGRGRARPRETRADVYVLRTSDGFVERVRPGPAWRASRKEAPGVRLRFVQKADKDGAPLRDGAWSISRRAWWSATTSARSCGPKRCSEDRLVGRRAGAGMRWPKSRMTAARFAAGRARERCRGLALERGPIDEALRALGLRAGDCRDRGGGVLERVGARERVGPHRDRSGASHGPASSRDAQLRAAGRDAQVHGVDAVAPAARRRRGAPLAAGMCA